MALVADQAPDAFPLDSKPPPALAASAASRFEVARLAEQHLDVSYLDEVRDIRAFHPAPWLWPLPCFTADPPAGGGPARDAPGPPRNDAAAAQYPDLMILANLEDAQRGLAGAAQAITDAQPRLPRPIRNFAASVAELASVVGELLDPPESESG